MDDEDVQIDDPEVETIEEDRDTGEIVA